jgi:hypothetical protein
VAIGDTLNIEERNLGFIFRLEKMADSNDKSISMKKSIN